MANPLYPSPYSGRKVSALDVNWPDLVGSIITVTRWKLADAGLTLVESITGKLDMCYITNSGSINLNFYNNIYRHFDYADKYTELVIVEIRSARNA